MISPFAPKSFPKMPTLEGVNLAVTSAGIKYVDKKDLLYVSFPKGASVAGVLTKNDICGAPIDWCRKILPKGYARALLVNSGNANVHTGHLGLKAVNDTTKFIGRHASCRPENVFVASTGVIGEVLPIDSILSALPELCSKKYNSPWVDAARAIMTTDTYPKAAWCRTKIGKTTVTINAIAKGSGMIAPNMATMLGFIFTDANLPSSILRGLIRPIVNNSFNSITVDGDTSTSDTCLIFATRQAKHPAVKNLKSSEILLFRDALNKICMNLAMQIVRDGEGVTKVASIRISGARSNQSGKRIAKSVAESPLVKTALAASDPNWGRLAAAAGNAGEKINQKRMKIWIGGQLVATDGGICSSYSEAKAVRHMKARSINIDIDLGLGNGSAQVWTSDLTHRYIEINAGYRS